VNITNAAPTVPSPTLQFLAILILALGTFRLPAATPPIPTRADVSYGPHPHQLMDIYMPPQGTGPCPVLLWYGGLWVPSKGIPDLNNFLPAHCAVIAVEGRTMGDAIQDKITPPVSVCLLDARRAVQFVRLHAAEWNLDPQRIAVAGGSQGTQPALYVAFAGEKADPNSSDPVERESTKVTCVGAWRSQTTLDPRRMQEWVPGVEYGAPSWGCSFPDSLKRRDELLPVISQWSPDALLTKDAPPIYIQYDWGLTKPDNVKDAEYKVHSPLFGLGLQKLAQKLGVTCYVKYPGQSPNQTTDGYSSIWDFLVKQLTQPSKGQSSVTEAPDSLVSASSQPQDDSRKKEVWLMPPGPGPQEPPSVVALRDFYLHPDDWKQTRAAMTATTVGVFGSTDNKMNKAFSPDEMRQFGQMLKGWNIKFGLEIESVTGSERSRTGQQVFDRQVKGLDAIQANGLPIYSFGMDEPYSKEVLIHHLPREEALQETANFIALMRQHFPDARIGDIEPYPALNLQELVAWVRDLQGRLAQMHVRGTDFFRLDYDWTHLMVDKHSNFMEVKELEVACRAMRVPFSFVYWAPPFGFYQRMGIADDSIWHTFVMWQGYAYALVNGDPDQYVLESWIGTPSTGTPETNPDSFSCSVLDFCNKFVLRPIGHSPF
jgi:acetyl esterase/lipase